MCVRGAIPPFNQQTTFLNQQTLFYDADSSCCHKVLCLPNKNAQEQTGKSERIKAKVQH